MFVGYQMSNTSDKPPYLKLKVAMIVIGLQTLYSRVFLHTCWLIVKSQDLSCKGCHSSTDLEILHILRCLLVVKSQTPMTVPFIIKRRLSAGHYFLHDFQWLCLFHQVFLVKKRYVLKQCKQLNA